MENIIKKQTSALAMHKQSHTISKSKPKIRIIHLFAPDIIKTDVANFRELVQRLTGKPEAHHHHHHHHHHHQQKGCNESPRTTRKDHHQVEKIQEMNVQLAATAKNMEMRNGFREDEEEENEMVWNNGDSSGGFLNSLGDLDGFIQELGGFPYLPLDAAHMHGGFAESQQFA